MCNHFSVSVGSEKSRLGLNVSNSIYSARPRSYMPMFETAKLHRLFSEKVMHLFIVSTNPHHAKLQTILNNSNENLFGTKGRLKYAQKGASQRNNLKSKG